MQIAKQEMTMDLRLGTEAGECCEVQGQGQLIMALVWYRS